MEPPVTGFVADLGDAEVQPQPNPDRGVFHRTRELKPSNQRLFPSRPDPTDDDPEEPVDHTDAWPWMPTLQHGQLLTEREILEKKAPTCPEEAA